MIDYADMAQTVAELILEAGGAITLKRTQHKKIDSNKPWKNDPDSVEQFDSVNVMAVRIDPYQASKTGILVVSEDNLRKLESVFLVDPGTSLYSEELDTFDRLVDFENKSWTVATLGKLKPYNKTLFYSFGVTL